MIKCSEGYTSLSLICLQTDEVFNIFNHYIPIGLYQNLLHMILVNYNNAQFYLDEK